MSEGRVPRDLRGCFDFNRLVASVAVLFSHSYALLQQSPAEPLHRLTGGRHDFGEIAVYVFFAMSGYLVTLSWQRDPNARRFLQRRALRVFPALIVVVLASALLFGPMMTTLGAGAYFSSLQTWTYLAKATAFPTQHALPGVFAQNPFANVVNGSLWSLRLEVSLYVALAGMGLIGMLRRPLLVLAMVVAWLAAGETLKRMSADVPATYCLNAAVFCIGIAMAQSRLPAHLGRVALLAWAACAAGVLIAPDISAIFVATFAPAVILTSIRCSVALQTGGDFSYGIYLWAFPVQQYVIAAAPGLAPLEVFALALPITVGLAVLSWHLIERPALTFKPGRQRLATLALDQRVASAASA